MMMKRIYQWLGIVLILVLLLGIFPAQAADRSVVYIGDCNADKIVDVKDVIRFKKYLATQKPGGTSAIEMDQEAADCTGDSKIDITDVTRLKKMLAQRLPASVLSAASLRAEEFLMRKTENDALFSFLYGGNDFAVAVGQWSKKTVICQYGWTDTVKVIYRSPDSVEFTVEATLDKQTAAIDYLAYFRNNAGADSPVISAIQPLDTEFGISDAVLTTAKGSTASESDFEPVTVDLAAVGSYTMQSAGGRSSDSGWPYFNLCNGEMGVMGAVGWSGNWKASFASTGAGVRAQAGMKKTSIALHAGERMRTPSIVLQFFDGDADAGQNAFRALMRKSYSPKDENGKSLTEAPVSILLPTKVSYEQVQTSLSTANAANRPYEALWIDAGWYGASTDWYYEAGSWNVNESIWPNGIKPLSDQLHADGKKLIVWLEAERAYYTSTLAAAHPEWMLSYKNYGDYLFNFANPDALDYMTGFMTSFLSSNGIDWYRMDLNITPDVYWGQADESEGKNREGITEIKYITNLYRYLDSLLQNLPSLRIDNCAAGGRRLDIEMMKRSTPLLRDDYKVGIAGTSADGVRAINYNLSRWIPVHAGNRGDDGMANDYQFRSLMSTGLDIGVNPTNKDNAWFNGAIHAYMDYRRLMQGDYYVLAADTGQSFGKANACYEYYLPEEEEGMLVAFCPSGSTTLSQTFRLKGLSPQKNYTIEIRDQGKMLTLSGEHLMRYGLQLTFKDHGTSLLVFLQSD